MKWGVRRKASTQDIKGARTRLKRESSAYRQESKKLSGATGAKKTALEADLRKRQQKYLNNPDRVIAARMTRGEKFVSVLLGAQSGVGLAGAAAGIAGTSGLSRRIEYKQEKGKYKVAKNARVQKRIGYDQAARPLIRAGALFAPQLLAAVGQQAVSAIGIKVATKAATNRETAKNAATGIASTAAKLKYAKTAKGAYKITTMK